MDWQTFITTDEQILLGKPIIKGTRLSVEFILLLLSQGWTEEQIFENYPQITKQSLQAVFAYLSSCMQDGLLLTPLKEAV